MTYSNVKIKHLLVIRLSAMGDVAIAAPVVYRLVKTYPNIKITILTRRFFAPIFLNILNVNILCFDKLNKHKGLRGLYKLSKEIHLMRVSAVADFHGVLRSYLLDFFLTLRGYQVAKIDKGRLEKKALTKPKNKRFTQLKSTFQRYADVFQALGFQIDMFPVLYLPKRNIPQNVTLKFNTKKIGLAPFAAYKSKTYDMQHITSIIENLSQRGGCEILLFGGSQEEIKSLRQLQKTYSNTISISGAYSFEEELAIISNLDVMVSMDSGNAHLAAMFGVPVVVIWGETHPYAGFAPLSKHINILPDLRKFPNIPSSVYGNKSSIHPDDRAINSIHPSLVIEAVDRMLCK